MGAFSPVRGRRHPAHPASPLPSRSPSLAAAPGLPRRLSPWHHLCSSSLLTEGGQEGGRGAGRRAAGGRAVASGACSTAPTRLPHSLGPCHVCGGYEPPRRPRRALTFMSGKITGLLIHEMPIHGFWRGAEPWDPAPRERETHRCARLAARQAWSQRQSRAPSPWCSSGLLPPARGLPAKAGPGEGRL